MNSVGNNLFLGLADATRTIVQFLRAKCGTEGDVSELVMACVCRAWRDNNVLLSERQKLITSIDVQVFWIQKMEPQESQFPQQYVDAFRNSGTPISRLPVLFTDRVRDFAIRSEQMSDSVMRFQVKGLPGIAMRIQAVADHRLISVLTMFRQSLDKQSSWTYEWETGGYSLGAIASEWHSEYHHTGFKIDACPTCPFNHAVNADFLASLLRGAHPELTIPGLDSSRTLMNRVRIAEDYQARLTAMVSRVVVIANVAKQTLQ